MNDKEKFKKVLVFVCEVLSFIIILDTRASVTSGKGIITNFLWRLFLVFILGTILFRILDALFNCMKKLFLNEHATENNCIINNVVYIYLLWIISIFLMYMFLYIYPLNNIVINGIQITNIFK